MPKIPVNKKTTKYRMESRAFTPEITRGYLGMSGIGKRCIRALWYGFHWVSIPTDMSVRMKRIFERGHLEEERVIRELTEIGIEVYAQYEPDGERIQLTGAIDEEQEEHEGFAGHAKGHPDGRLLGVIEAPKTPHLLEIKTAKASRWKVIADARNLKKSDEEYYGQCQRLMDAMGLKRTLFIATNKDTEERYYERVYYDKQDALHYKQLEMIIVTSEKPPEKISQVPSWKDCFFCKHKPVCHKGAPINKTCRSCVHADMVDNGGWVCSKPLAFKHKGKGEYNLSLSEQVKGCRNHKTGWGLDD